ncbi:NADPH-dependent FMN reductase [Aliiruegeria sabulilitoris]|uniref:NADPH-dependent FMN reductase n=1 Tax=Aliiruegeria sabulilitoris TaxID=1510458 RepID=UPI00083380ED|nr:NADPH-dependent FMN reductase [Aliiruegeria sabulilitoris]NDR57876.1 NAD(P)H-dependent oxidoreductase [Pseudoruegeria sp. M32A2M]
MTTIFGLSGSLRRASFNASLLQAAKAQMPPGTELKIGSIADVPLYNADVESEGVPEPVLHLREQIAAADGLLLVTPEYNNGIPGVFKNALDWIGSGPGADVFKGKPVAVIGASPGGFGTIMAQTQWLQVLRALQARQYHEGRLLVSGARKLFNDHGTLTDDATTERLAAFLDGFVISIAG